MSQKKIEIIGNALVITDLTSDEILLDVPKNDVYFNYEELRRNNVVKVYDVDGVNFRSAGIIEYPISEVEDSEGVVFTKETFKSFFRINVSAVKVETTQLNGVPSSFTKLSGSGKTLLIQKGQLNKWRVRPQILNEHAESSREIQEVVDATTIVGQIFKASQDNINGIVLTMWSAAGVSLDNFEGYANSAALQVEWAKGGTNEALLETTIVKTGAKSMELPGGVVDDNWIDTIISVDYTDFVFSFDFYQDETYTRLKYEFTIGDGTNTATFSIISSDPNEWHNFTIDINSMTGIGAVNTGAITKIGFKVVDRDVAKTAYVDNLVSTPAAGSVKVKLWDMGADIPVTTVTSLDDGTQYTELGDRGLNGGTVAAEINVSLTGGKKQYQLNTFVAGVALEIPANTTLIKDNYYAITIHHVDTDVNIYGPDTSFAAQYYNNGYAFTAPNEATAISAIGDLSNLMFEVFSTQDAYVTQYIQAMVTDAGVIASAGSNSSVYSHIEDKNMSISDVISTTVPTSTEITIDLSVKPFLIPKGGKYEVYLNDDFMDNIFAFGGAIGYLYEPPIVNG